ncbi:MAG: DNA repair protein RecO [Dysgonamonadaceae bacterium]|jgi:DNA repair protein RecO (recombination protein O)|nr:DNA repair protein RecO [Dysgonamonadaceae bacterium]
MLHKTKGIVLHSLNYNDQYRIIHIYTEEFGRVPYLVLKSKGKKTAVSTVIFHPFAVLELEVDHQHLREIQRIREARPSMILTSIPFDPVKMPVVMFLAEFMFKVVKDVQANSLLFDFVSRSIAVFDLLETGIANFHLVFMIKLSRFLGFYPNGEGYTVGMFFDMQHGMFVRNQPNHPFFLPPDDSKVFRLLLRMNYENMHIYAFSRHDRMNIIRKILDYYKVHFSSLTELKSLEVLQMLFD